MKMRGCSVLFVCALCVFVLCGAAAAVVAQEVTPEKKAAGEAKGFADMAKQKGTEALGNYTEFGNNLNVVTGELTRAIAGIVASNRTADTVSVPREVPSREVIKEDIGKLKEKADIAKDLVERLRAADVDSLKDQGKKDELTNKMTDVESKMTGAKAAADAVTGDNPTTIDAVITKAGELKTAAEEARVLWTAAEGKLEEELGKATAAVAAINATKNDIESATKKFITNRSPTTENLNTQLTDVVTHIVTPSLSTLSSLKTVLQNAKDAAGEAKKQYTALATAAEELKGNAEERKRKLQPEKRKDYSAGPLCSLALPVFFFCWCVLFGM